MLHDLLDFLLLYGATANGLQHGVKTLVVQLHGGDMISHVVVFACFCDQESGTFTEFIVVHCCYTAVSLSPVVVVVVVVVRIGCSTGCAAVMARAARARPISRNWF